MSNLDLLLARALSSGTWLSALVIVLGLALGFAGWPSASARKVISIGIAILILLPTLRVLLMLGVFVKKREYKFAAFATIVLIVIVSGIVIGAR